MLDMISVLYFHGFASSPAGDKITALRPLLAPAGIALNAPDLNVPSFEKLDFDRIVDRAVAEARRQPPAAMVGSSMGALVALAAARRGIVVPLVLIAPAIGGGAKWRTTIADGDPVMMFNHARKADAPIHRAFFEQMATLHVDDHPPPQRVTVIMGRKDETVSFEIVRAAWERWEASGRLAKGSRFIELAEGDHGLVAYAEVIRGAIVEAVR